jgi:hypothetical protein
MALSRKLVSVFPHLGRIFPDMLLASLVAGLQVALISGAVSTETF